MFEAVIILTHLQEVIKVVLIDVLNLAMWYVLNGIKIYRVKKICKLLFNQLKIQAQLKMY